MRILILTGLLLLMPGMIDGADRNKIITSGTPYTNTEKQSVYVIIELAPGQTFKHESCDAAIVHPHNLSGYLNRRLSRQDRMRQDKIEATETRLETLQDSIRTIERELIDRDLEHIVHEIGQLQSAPAEEMEAIPEGAPR